ncbi:hypothetical protein [Vreelandella populi]|uniref:Sulfotransferase domain-containing protein n=1 Tax=Vreelandella populi TaxID=2498858 RepID=A0A3S0WJ40_9GAMM|nr:hypothetical protein [Halomonas populi]RUR46000.1 hypothetical protein ELY37_08345 [Halomonas populi]
MKEIILHLGVHKTATTYFQSRLYNSISQLANAGVGYLGLNETREYITSKINGNFKVEGDLENLFKESSTVVISDENIIGGTEKISSELIYPEVEKRLSFLLGKLPITIGEVHITIRDPEAYLISRYCEYLRHYKFLSSSEYFDSFNLRAFSWLPLIQKIEKITSKKVIVTPFETLFNDEQQYLEKLCGVEIDFQQAGEGAAIRRSKITQEAYRILEHLADHYPRHMTKKLMNMMDNNKQHTKGSPFRPFSAELSEVLKKNYQMDKEELGLF